MGRDNKYLFYRKSGQQEEYTNGGDQTAREWLNKFKSEKDKPLYPYAVSSVETNMIEVQMNEAIEIADVDSAEENEIRSIFQHRLDNTEYQSWSGD